MNPSSAMTPRVATRASARDANAFMALIVVAAVAGCL